MRKKIWKPWPEQLIALFRWTFMVYQQNRHMMWIKKSGQTKRSKWILFWDGHPRKVVNNTRQRPIKKSNRWAAARVNNDQVYQMWRHPVPSQWTRDSVATGLVSTRVLNDPLAVLWGPATMTEANFNASFMGPSVLIFIWWGSVQRRHETDCPSYIFFMYPANIVKTLIFWCYREINRFTQPTTLINIEKKYLLKLT